MKQNKTLGTLLIEASEFPTALMIAVGSGTVNDIISFVESSPGKIDLCFRIIDREHRNSYSLRSSVAKIDISHALVTYIDSREGLDFEIN